MRFEQLWAGKNYMASDNYFVIAINEKTHRAYVTDNADGSVTVIDTKTDKVTSTIAVSNSFDDFNSVDEKTNAVYVPLIFDAALDVVDGKTNKIVDKIPLGTPPTPLGCLDFNSTVTCTDFGGGPASPIPVNQMTNKVYVVVADNYANAINDNQIVVLDANTHHIIDKMDMGHDHHDK